MEFRRVSINKWPWNDAAARKDMACGKDANTLWLSDDRALLFHITSEENSKAILANGAQAKVCRIGFDGREQQKAFWANCVPIVSHSVEIWMPHIEGGNVCVLGVEVERQTLIERYHFEPSWSFWDHSRDSDFSPSIHTWREFSSSGSNCCFLFSWL